jgi:ribosomal protein S18 acetylase RimI-like enzyme
MQIRAYQIEDESTVVELWEQCGLTRPWNDPRKDIRRKLAAQPELFFVGLVEEKIVGTVMAGYEGHRGWINYLAVSPEFRRRGLGRLLMQHAERTLIGLGCPKINLQIRSANASATAFYRRLGYVEDDVVSFGKRLEHDD